ncbi:hypothetical protein ANSO36C_09920 [Nostoc cf. commune SO-36]|uniref:Uncharacterized protein n=1 Tax=Nostoc cf. commune SO-36 TaxID=449208 RepID=A0ABN6PYU5_NOSCO|nr:hypothetical protein [Nostoc commune]BDI15190.1 hypothetical protein ANSO36C_09920 [Nostoc cf. commune SO-36]
MQIDYTATGKARVLDSFLRSQEEAYLDESALKALKEKNLLDNNILEGKDFQIFREDKTWQIVHKFPISQAKEAVIASFLPKPDMIGSVTNQLINGKSIYICHF